MPAFANCPSGPVAPGSTVVLVGTCEKCSDTSCSVTKGGAPFPHTWKCDGGAWKITIQVPACEASGDYIIGATVSEGGAVAACDVLVNCP